MTHDTSKLEKGACFPETSWTRILHAQGADEASSAEQMNALLEMYWPPVYLLLRRGYGQSVEDAKDTVQEFFRVLLERKFIKDLQPSKGSFRIFLKTSLKNFMTDAYRRQGALKRSGSPVVNMHVHELERQVSDSSSILSADPFDAEWRRSILERACMEVEKKLSSKGKSRVWDIFSVYTESRLKDADPITYRAMAVRYDLKESDIRNYLHLVREAIRAAATAIVRDSVSGNRELTDELRIMLG